MTNTEVKEMLILRKMSSVLRDSEVEIEILEVKEPEETLALKKWLVDKRALHEIKYLANRAGTYNNYRENELDDIETCLNQSLDNKK